jgi:hypothetical protein
MNQNRLKSYDITLFDIEQTFNNQIAPIEKKIEKINSQHESKSKTAHKDFIAKEKKSKATINTLNEKNTLKFQRIEKAVENKLTKLKSKKQRLTEQLDAFINEQIELQKLEQQTIKDNIVTLQQDEQNQLQEIDKKFQTNIETYFEKLDIYNNNYKNNQTIHHEKINNYKNKLLSYLDEIEQQHNNLLEELSKRLQEQINQKNNDDQEILIHHKETIKHLNEAELILRKQANDEIEDISKLITTLKANTSKHYQTKIKQLSNQLFQIRKEFEERRQVIEQDLKRNIDKQELALDDTTQSRKAKKIIQTKINLFNARATTVLKYEESILEQFMSQISNQINLLREQQDIELLNIEKLNVFLTTDQTQLKDTGVYLKGIHQVLSEQLDNFEYSNNEYIKKHQELKIEFNKQYIKIFKTLKESLVSVSQMYLTNVADNNFKLDEISSFLDTAEPQKEIKVNDLRKEIEKNEVLERFKIKYAKEQFDLDLISDKFNAIITEKEQETKIEISEIQKQISEIRNKEQYDKTIEQAKLKQAKANEIYKLRLNSNKLERNLLTNRYNSDIEILQLQKELNAIEVRKHDALLSKELEASIKNYELEISYQEEMIQKGLEETILQINEKQQKIENEKQKYLKEWQKEYDQELTILLNNKKIIEQNASKQRSLIKQALERELKQPTNNKLKSETIIDERLKKFDSNNVFYIDYITGTIDNFKGTLLSKDQLHEVISNHNQMIDKASKYITTAFQVLKDGQTFMGDLEKHNIENQINTSTDSFKTRKLKKAMSKYNQDYEKTIQTILKKESDYQEVLKATINTEMEKLKRVQVDTIDELIEQTELTFYLIFDKLKSIQEQCKEDTINLYQNLTKTDQEIIDHATKNSEIALEKVDIKEQADLAPIEQEMATLKTSKEQEKTKFLDTFNQEIAELDNEIAHLRNEARSQSGFVKEEKIALIQSKKEQLSLLEEEIEKKVVQKYEEIDNQIQKLEERYTSELEKMDSKDLEAKKIYDYEDRIYNIALSNATARLNEADKKANIVHTENSKIYQKHIENAKKMVDENSIKYNKQLLELSKQFERNIFTTRPRIEESIGDAQKEIDIEIIKKKEEYNRILEENNKLISSAATQLFANFNEGYEKLHNNVTDYIEKYKVIEQTYFEENNQSNQKIRDNFKHFSQTLFEMSKTKHKVNIIELERINSTMFNEEV